MVFMQIHFILSSFLIRSSFISEPFMISNNYNLDLILSIKNLLFLYDQDSKLKNNINSDNMQQTSTHTQKLLPERQDSFYIKVQEDDDIQPHQLSGDQNAQKSILLSDLAGGGKANFLLTVTTIIKTVIGAGILSLPFTISKLGVFFGTLIYLIVVVINQFTSTMLLKAKNLSRHSNYSTIMRHLFNSKVGQAISSALIMINNLGVNILQLTIFKQALRQIFQDWVPEEYLQEFYLKQWFIIVVLAIFEIPFIIVKKIQRLKFMAFIGVAGIVVFIICLMITFFDQMFQRDWNIDQPLQMFPRDWGKVASVIPNIMLALSFQMNFFPIYKGLKNSNDTKFGRATLVGLSTVAFCYILVGIVGYTMYGSKVKSNFLLNLDPKDLNDVLYFLMNIGFLTSVFFSFPVMFFGARNNFIALIQMFMSRNKQQKVVRQDHKDSIQQISSYIQNGTRQQRKRKATILFYVFTFILVAIIVLITILVGDIQVVFNLVGSIASNAIGYICPCMFYYLFIKYKGKAKTMNYHFAKAIFYFFIPFGIFAVVSLYI